MAAGGGRPPGPPAGGGGDSARMRMPPHPLTLDGSAVLHQMFRMRWGAWRTLERPTREAIARESAARLQQLESLSENRSALFSMLGHKGDLLFLHFRPTLEDLNHVELGLVGTPLYDFLEPTTSYVSIVELGLYDSSVTLYQQMLAEGIEPDSETWKARLRDRIGEQASMMAPRLDPEVPPNKYLCFYPMDKKRGERRNWYSVPIEDRRRMMREHGMIGRRFAGRVKQIISGSIGFDDWEWGVDLFADDPLVFKQLIYEMRFDEASAVYALFGPFYISLRLHPSEFPAWLNGESPRMGLE